jgi:hypothetical protein
MTKEEFFENLEEIKGNKILITDCVDRLNEEIRHNCHLISMPQGMVDEVTLEELTAFFKDLKETRKKQLKNSTTRIGLIYYIWHERQAGQIRFNLINSNHRKLPFDAPLTFVDREEEILSEFLAKRGSADRGIKIYRELLSIDEASRY